MRGLRSQITRRKEPIADLALYGQIPRRRGGRFKIVRRDLIESRRNERRVLIVDNWKWISTAHTLPRIIETTGGSIHAGVIAEWRRLRLIQAPLQRQIFITERIRSPERHPPVTLRIPG